MEVDEGGEGERVGGVEEHAKEAEGTTGDKGKEKPQEESVCPNVIHICMIDFDHSWDISVQMEQRGARQAGAMERLESVAEKEKAGSMGKEKERQARLDPSLPGRLVSCCVHVLLEVG